MSEPTKDAPWGADDFGWKGSKVVPIPDAVKVVRSDGACIFIESRKEAERIGKHPWRSACIASAYYAAHA